MPSYFFLFTSCLVIALSLGTAHGSDLTLIDALRRATTDHPRLAAQSARERAAQAMLEQARLRPTPTLDLGAENFLGTGATREIRRLETTVQISQTFERVEKSQKRVTVADRNRTIAAAQFDVLRTEVLGATARAYVDVITVQHHLTLAEETCSLARATLTAAAGRFQAGASSPAEVARARAAVATSQADRSRQQAALAAARAALAAMWRDHPTQLSPLRGTIRLPDALPAEAHFLALLAKHPQLALQQAITGSELAGLALVQAQAVPDITASGGLRFLREGSDAAFVAGISIPFPTRHRQQGNLRAAREAIIAAEHTTLAVTAELQAATCAAWQNCQSALATATTLRREALPATEEAHRILQTAYEAGQVPLLEVLEAQRSLHTLRRDILDAEASTLIALVHLESLTQPTFPLTTALLASP